MPRHPTKSETKIKKEPESEVEPNKLILAADAKRTAGAKREVLVKEVLRELKRAIKRRMKQGYTSLECVAKALPDQCSFSTTLTADFLWSVNDSGSTRVLDGSVLEKTITPRFTGCTVQCDKELYTDAVTRILIEWAEGKVQQRRDALLDRICGSISDDIQKAMDAGRMKIQYRRDEFLRLFRDSFFLHAEKDSFFHHAVWHVKAAVVEAVLYPRLAEAGYRVVVRKERSFSTNITGLDICWD
jgi:hypothetical protein